MRITTSLFRRVLTVAVGTALAMLGACDDPTKPIEGAGDPENISRVTITLTPVAGGASVSSSRFDPDGTQGVQPVGAATGTLTLTKGATYSGVVTLLNDLDSKNVVDISGEVRKEANFHRFFYTVSCNGVSVPDGSLDLDTQSPTPYPVGLTFQVVVDASASSTASCTLHVELHHFEAAKGNGLGTTFDTDLSIDFPITVQ